jgi:two-component system, OmpR family, manganese sensing sensor histidine kinase
LLLLARGDRHSEKRWQTISISNLLHDLTQPYQFQAKIQSLQLLTKISPALWIRGDEMQLSRLFKNLIDNAFYYTPAPGIVTVHAHQRGSHVEISIEDTGVGIAPECLDQVFDRFWRADLSRTYWAGGSGLGLAIAQSVAQIHGGKISVVSQLGHGSKFTVLLPVAR